MKESAWAYLILMLGIAIIAIMLLVQNLTSKNEENFYLTREVLEASMYDAVDYGTYARSGKLVMSEQKFVEVFLRRFSESVTNNRTYNINFYDIHEYPPKATVLITTNTGDTKVTSSESINININTYLSAILETVSNYNEKMKISKKTPMFDTEENALTDTLACGTDVYMSFKFLADNDPCGLYKEIDKKGNPIKFSRDASDRTIEYCRVINVETKKEYFVEKSSLVKPEDWGNAPFNSKDYTSKYCGIN